MRCGASRMNAATSGPADSSILAMASATRIGRPQRTEGDELRQAVVEVLADVALRVGDDRAGAAVVQLLDARDQVVAQRPRPRLEQHPGAGLVERHEPQLGRAEAVERRLGHLAPRRDRDGDAALGQHDVELARALRDLVDAHVVVVADVRRRADHVDPVLGGLARERHRILEVGCAVVDPRQDVAVEVDEPHGRQPYQVRGRAALRRRRVSLRRRGPAC
jgi:hypothetical protein